METMDDQSAKVFKHYGYISTSRKDSLDGAKPGLLSTCKCCLIQK